jgi:hypothetical protein
MSGRDPFKPHPAGDRHLRDWITSIFRSATPVTRLEASEISGVAGDSSHLDVTAAAPSSQDQDVKTPLLEGYERGQPICGLTHCNHGTFSPTAREEGDNGDFPPFSGLSQRLGPLREDSDDSDAGAADGGLWETNTLAAKKARSRGRQTM